MLVQNGLSGTFHILCGKTPQRRFVRCHLVHMSALTAQQERASSVLTCGSVADSTPSDTSCDWYLSRTVCICSIVLYLRRTTA